MGKNKSWRKTWLKDRTRETRREENTEESWMSDLSKKKFWKKCLSFFHWPSRDSSRRPTNFVKTVSFSSSLISRHSHCYCYYWLNGIIHSVVATGSSSNNNRKTCFCRRYVVVLTTAHLWLDLQKLSLSVYQLIIISLLAPRSIISLTIAIIHTSSTGRNYILYFDGNIHA